MVIEPLILQRLLQNSKSNLENQEKHLLTPVNSCIDKPSCFKEKELFLN